MWTSLWTSCAVGVYHPRSHWGYKQRPSACEVTVATLSLLLAPPVSRSVRVPSAPSPLVSDESPPWRLSASLPCPFHAFVSFSVSSSASPFVISVDRFTSALHRDVQLRTANTVPIITPNTVITMTPTPQPIPLLSGHAVIFITIPPLSLCI